MQNPADLVTIRSGLITNAVAGNPTDTVVLVGPGAGLRYRIWMLQAAPGVHTSTGLFQGWWRWPIGTAQIGMSSLLQNGVAWQLYPPGGIALPLNAGIDIRHRCSAASQTVDWLIGYVIERASM